jgi:hypothetical protein
VEKNVELTRKFVKSPAELLSAKAREFSNVKSNASLENLASTIVLGNVKNVVSSAEFQQNTPTDVVLT